MGYRVEFSKPARAQVLMRCGIYPWPSLCREVLAEWDGESERVRVRALSRDWLVVALEGETLMVWYLEEVNTRC